MCLCICKFLFFLRTAHWKSHDFCCIIYNSVGTGWMLSTTNNNASNSQMRHLESHHFLSVQCLNLVMQMHQIISYMNLTTRIFNHWCPSRGIGLFFFFFTFDLGLISNLVKSCKTSTKNVYISSPRPQTSSKVGQFSQQCPLWYRMQSRINCGTWMSHLC